MSEPREPLERIADALERIAPSATATTDWLAHPAYVWAETGVVPVSELAAQPLDTLRGIDKQKAAVRENLARFAGRAAAHDMLLWGARGMGKSALVRSAVAAIQDKDEGKLALVQISTASLSSFPSLIEQLGSLDRSFLLFIDDLGFGAGETQANLALRSLLDGGLVARPANVRLAVTSNRRAIVGRDDGEREALHERDERDNALALADRFGLTLGFHPCDRETYLEILRAYTDPLGLGIDEEEALAWAIARGNRSGRTAWQFACELAGRAGLSL